MRGVFQSFLDNFFSQMTRSIIWSACLLGLEKYTCMLGWVEETV